MTSSAISVLVVLAIATVGLHPRAPAGVHLRPQLLPGEGGLRRRVGGDGRPGAVGDDRRRGGRADRRRAAGARPGRGDDGHLQALRAHLPQRHGAAASAHAAQGHVPGARSRNGQRRQAARTAARSGSRAPSPTSTSTRSSARSTPTRAPTCCCCCPAARRRSTARAPPPAAPSAGTSAALAADFKHFAPLDRSALNFTKLLSAAQLEPEARHPQPQSGRQLRWVGSTRS